MIYLDCDGPCFRVLIKEVTGFCFWEYCVFDGDDITNLLKCQVFE